MIEEEIKKKRKELNKSIENNGEYEKVYKLSVELDDLITEFYKDSQTKRKVKTKRVIRKKNNINRILYIA